MSEPESACLIRVTEEEFYENGQCVYEWLEPSRVFEEGNDGGGRRDCGRGTIGP